MKKINKILRGAVLAVFLGIVVAVPTFAAQCSVGTDLTGDYAGLQISNSDISSSGYIKCSGATVNISGVDYNIWGKSSADCAKAGSLAANPDGCDGQGLNDTVQLIINMIIFAVGLIAVVMVIIGGIQYSTSQGDSGKVKKAKDTIMYGIIGLVVAILAFAIVNFVLTSIIQ